VAAVAETNGTHWLVGSGRQVSSAWQQAINKRHAKCCRQTPTTTAAAAATATCCVEKCVAAC